MVEYNWLRNFLVWLLLALSCLALEELNLNREAIRKSILQYRARRSIIIEEAEGFSPRLVRRVRRDVFPTDDEEFYGSGDDLDNPTEITAVALSKKNSTALPQVPAEWVFYRSNVNFLDSIEYSEDLKDYNTDKFYSLSEKIMFAVEDYLRSALPGYQEATPLMFTQKPTGEVHVLIDIGTCSTITEATAKAALLNLLRTGRLGDLAVSTQNFTIKEVGRDPRRQECNASIPISTTTTVAISTTSTSTPRTEPTPPDFDVFVSTTRRQPCRPDQATCTNLECIDKSMRCNNVRDCSDGSDEINCGNEAVCDPTEFLCPDTGSCVQKMWKCDGDDDCGDGYDELSCPSASPESKCRGIEFECQSDSLCVPASYQCDGEQDCRDGSDESECSRPVVINGPTRNVTVTAGETVVLTCEAVGVPTPIISWRLNWGNVGSPPRVSMTSVDGKGELVIKRAEITDQGAYSCEAINSQGSIFAVPDAILTVLPGLQGDCPLGEYGMEVEACRPCFCFGVTDLCGPLEKAYEKIEVTFETPEDVNKVDLEPAEAEGADPAPSSRPINRNQEVVNPAARELQLIDLSKRFLAAAHYWSLPAQFVGAKINSYGGTLTFSFSYNNSYNFEPKPTNYSDVIIEGANGNTLTYHHKGDHPGPTKKHTRNVTLTEDNWKTPVGEEATREDMLGVLNNVSKIQIRTVYDNSMLSTGLGDVEMTVASSEPGKAGSDGSHGAGAHGGLDSELDGLDGAAGDMAYAVEKCECPEGYSGLSCQYCEPGWIKVMDTPTRIKCERDDGGEPEPPCPEGYVGEGCRFCATGYEMYDRVCLKIRPNEFDCDEAGTATQNRSCVCKTNVEGDRCAQCKNGFFNLDADNADGCNKCFCFGVATECRSTYSHRAKMIPDYSKVEGFMLKNAGRSGRILNDIQLTRLFGRQVLRADLSSQPRDVFYWVLPKLFIGNRLTSYGGSLRYTIEFNQGEDARVISSADVKITGRGFTVEYRGDSQPTPAVSAAYDVKLIEDQWTFANGAPVDHESFMKVLSDVEEILIRATYATDMIDTSIYDISLEIAHPQVSSGPRAVEVEECVCPPGYTGTSCEECADGYWRSTAEPYLGQCTPCSCNNHGAKCDKVTGKCLECANYTTGDRCEKCTDGFYGDPRIGKATDCKPCPCPMLPSSSESERVTTCTLDVDGRPTCDDCPPGRTGRMCDICPDGREPSELRGCKPQGACECHPNGSVDATCDEAGQCSCKSGTDGLKCDVCKPSYFYFSIENTEGGCLPCFCMGVTTQCESSNYVRVTVNSDFKDGADGFSITNRLRTQRIVTGLRSDSLENVLSYTPSSSLPDDVYYWSLPADYLGDKVVSHGGNLLYTVAYTPSLSGVEATHPDVIIVGNDITLMASIDRQVPPRESTTRQIKFTAPYWTRSNGQPATKEHLLMALADLDALLIRATYSTSMVETSITNVAMETATLSDITGGDLAYEVEHCTCPDGYEGLSCEDCSTGYTRESSGMYLGICKPCQCNGRADACDSETGDCIDCEDNTAGPKCESCAVGFYTMSAEVEDLYCMPCACPGAGDNSFSDTCEFVPETRQLNCTACQEGYRGSRCELCAVGYEGNPRVDGGKCERVKDGASAPTVTVSPSSTRISVGNIVRLSCIVKSASPVDITWRRTDGQPVAAVVERSPEGSVLTIHSLTRSDAGTYECIATNDAGTGRASGVINLAPKREKMVVKVQEPVYRRLPAGSNVTFVCTADSVMNGYILYWSKQNDRLPHGRATEFHGILHITNLSPEDSGIYVCTGSNMYDIDRKTAELLVVEGTPEIPKKPSVVIEPARRVVQEGGSAHFRCKADGSKPIRIEWRPSSGETLPTNSRVIDGNLYLPAVSASDSAVFYCRAHNAHGYSEATAVLDVTVVGTSPVVTVLTPTSVHSEEGGNVEMRCKAVGFPEPTFSWRRVGSNELPSNARAEGGVLVLTDVRGQNSDTYICSARNAFGVDSGAIFVNITVEGQIQKPVCTTDPEFMTVYLGADTSVTCIPQGDPLPTVTWVRSNGKPLPQNAKIEGAKLVIKVVTADNAGKYVCVATNPGGTTRSEMTLRVENKTLPMVEILPRTRQVVEVGASASFTCRPTEGMPVEVTWSRSGRRPFTGRTNLEDNGVIKFTNVTTDEEGTYICLARNVVGFREIAALLTVTQKPKLTIEPALDVELHHGGSVTLCCNADGIPVPHVAWQQVYAFSGVRTITHYRRQHVAITVRADDIRSTTEYVCVARSSSGITKEKVVVTVVDGNRNTPPVIIVEHSALSVPLGEKAELRCEASGYPTPTIQWSKQQDQLPSGSGQEGGLLTIEKVDRGSGGVYICEAQNSAGRDTARSTINILTPPKISINPGGGILQIAAGGSQVVTCSTVEGSEPISYRFEKVHGSLPSSMSSSGNRLTITNFSPATESGAYACVASNSAGTATAEITILPLEAPNVIVSESEMTVTAGDAIEVRCVASEGAERAWTRVGSVGLDQSRGTYTDGVLRIPSSQVSDTGEYKCTAFNDAGSTEKSVYILVQELPKVTISLSKSPDQIRVGTSLEIVCSAVGEPTPSVTITKDGQEVLDAHNGRLIIKSVTQSDAGTYTCLASNTAGNAQDDVAVVVKAPLMMSIIPDIDVIEVKSGDELAISCVVKGTELDVEWTKTGGELPDSAVILDGTLMQIDSVSTAHAGEYVCTAETDGQTLTKSIKVTVHALIPNFSQTPISYISITPKQDLYGDFTITVSFRPYHDEGLILYSGGGVGDYVSLLLRNGKVEFRYNVGSGDGVLQSKSAVELYEWHTVVIKRDGREGSLVVDGQDPIYGQSEGSFQGLNVDGVLYVGGLPSPGASLPSALQFLGNDVGLYGCISQLDVSGEAVDFGSSVLVRDKVGILDCETCGKESESSPCEHGAKCTASHLGQKGYVCSCADEYVGPECQFRKEDICGDIGVCGQHGSCIPDYSRELGYRCQCFQNFIGPKCQFIGLVTNAPEPIAIPEATSFSKGSYMTLDVTHDDVTTFSAQLKVKLRSLDDGLILYNGAELSRRRKRAAGVSDVFTSIALVNGSLEFRYSCGSGTAVLRSQQPLRQVNRWYVIRAQRQNRQGILQIDGEIVAEGQSPAGSRRANQERSLYIGGVKFWDDILNQVGVSVGMDGCIDEVYVNRNKRSLHAHTGSKNVEACVEGDRFPLSSAAASRPSDIANSPVDRVEVSGTSAKFTGNSFISFPQEVFRHNTGAEQISLHFKTKDPDGLLFLQGRSGRDYILLGMKDARLEYAFQLGSSHRTAETAFRLSDGRWHNITVLRRGSLSMLWVDEVDFPVAVQADIEPPSDPVLGDLFIGGAADVPMYTGDRYRKGLRGCVKNVKVTSLTEEQSQRIGATYFDDAAITPLRFGRDEGRKVLHNVSNCRGEKSRTNELQFKRR